MHRRAQPERHGDEHQDHGLDHERDHVPQHPAGMIASRLTGVTRNRSMTPARQSEMMREPDERRAEQAELDQQAGHEEAVRLCRARQRSCSR